MICRCNEVRHPAGRLRGLEALLCPQGTAGGAPRAAQQVFCEIAAQNQDRTLVVNDNAAQPLILRQSVFRCTSRVRVNFVDRGGARRFLAPAVGIAVAPIHDFCSPSADGSNPITDRKIRGANLLSAIGCSLAFSCEGWLGFVMPFGHLLARGRPKTYGKKIIKDVRFIPRFRCYFPDLL
jgi:hypothetical protein